MRRGSEPGADRLRGRVGWRPASCSRRSPRRRRTRGCRPRRSGRRRRCHRGSCGSGRRSRPWSRPAGGRSPPTAGSTWRATRPWAVRWSLTGVASRRLGLRRASRDRTAGSAAAAGPANETRSRPARSERAEATDGGGHGTIVAATGRALGYGLWVRVAWRVGTWVPWAHPGIPTTRAPVTRRRRRVGRCRARTEPKGASPWLPSAEPKPPGPAHSRTGSGTVSAVTSGRSADLPVSWSARTEVRRWQDQPGRAARGGAFRLLRHGPVRQPGPRRAPARSPRRRGRGHVRQGRGGLECRVERPDGPRSRARDLGRGLQRGRRG